MHSEGLLLGTGIFLGACGDQVPMETGEPAPPCTPAPTWSEGQVAFLEQTSGWGLSGVVGVRLVAVDFDGDGWTDLVVHRGGDSVDFEGTRRSWLLRNDQGQAFVDVTQSSGFRAMRSSAIRVMGARASSPSGTSITMAISTG